MDCNSPDYLVADVPDRSSEYVLDLVSMSSDAMAYMVAVRERGELAALGPFAARLEQLLADGSNEERGFADDFLESFANFASWHGGIRGEVIEPIVSVLGPRARQAINRWDY